MQDERRDERCGGGVEEPVDCWDGVLVDKRHGCHECQHAPSVGWFRPFQIIAGSINSAVITALYALGIGYGGSVVKGPFGGCPGPERGRCAFCGEPGKLSLEHAIPWWAESGENPESTTTWYLRESRLET